MAQLIFHVENQYIHRLDEFHVVARSNNYLYAEFTFSDDWVGVKTALFSVEADNGETITKPMLIGADGTCEVPNEVLQYDDSQLEVSAFCGNRVTANKAIVIVHASGYNDESAPDDPTPDVYTQILNRLANVEQIVINKATEAESWAIGGTDTREGEDTDNAKYYAEQTSQSATNAAQSAASASESATSASGSASAASASAGIASEKATEATTAKSSIDIAVDEIRGMETNARTYSQNAAHSAEEAAETISVVRGYSETASQSARSASSSASDASASATSASGSASRASGYATNAHNYAAASERSMQSAATSERNTQGYASNAATSATNASGSETNAAASASQAADSASAASTSASAAASAKTDAETAQSAAETAQQAAETAAEGIRGSAAQISTNTQNIAANTAQIAQNTSDITDLKDNLNQKADVIISTASGSIAHFEDGAEADAVSAIAYIEPVQEGSGDPSPDNVRPITGHTEMDVVVSPTTDAQDGTTYPITFPTEAGTVYGGYVDVTRGKLVVDRIVDHPTSVRGEQISKYHRCYIGVPNGMSVKKLPSAVAISDMLKSAPMGITASDTFSVSQYGGANNIYFVSLDSSYTTMEKYNTWLSENRPTIILVLATPIEYDIAPQQIALLKSYNNVWNSAGGNTEVQYKADTKLYIEQLTKPTEDDMTANANIASGKFFMVGNRLFLSTSAIASGDTINPDTNCTELSLADALNNIN